MWHTCPLHALIVWRWQAIMKCHPLVYWNIKKHRTTIDGAVFYKMPFVFVCYYNLNLTCLKFTLNYVACFFLWWLSIPPILSHILTWLALNRSTFTATAVNKIDRKESVQKSIISFFFCCIYRLRHLRCRSTHISINLQLESCDVALWL